jgi:hypothetical protein
VSATFVNALHGPDSVLYRSFPSTSCTPSTSKTRLEDL